MQRIVFYLIFCLSLLPGCRPPSSAGPRPVVVVLSAPPATLDPRFATDAVGMRIANLIFQSLVRVGPDLAPEGDAVDDWQEEGQQKYLFHLRPALRFHNQRELDCADIEFSFEIFSRPGRSNSVALQNVSHLKCTSHLDHLDLELRLKSPNAKFLISDLPSVKLLPKREILERPEDFARNLPGSGPFRFIEQSSANIRLKRILANSSPLEVEFKVIRDDFTRYQKLLRGEVDIAANELAFARVADFAKRSEDFVVHQRPGLSMNYILINFSDPALSQLSVREYLAQSLDLPQLIQHKLYGFARPATALISPASPMFAPDLAAWSFVSPRGRPASPPAGLRAKTLQLLSSNTPAALDNAKTLAKLWGQAAINIDLKSYEWGTFYNDVNKGRFELALMRWVGAVDADLYRTALHSGEFPPGRNRGRYSNPELDRLLDAGEKILDPEERKLHYFKVQELALKDLAIIPLWYEDNVWVIHRRIRGFTPNTPGDYRFLSKIEVDGT